MEWFNDHKYNNNLVRFNSKVERQFICFRDSVRCQQE